jgi:LCP family protein required for cell wall assembly
VFVTVLSVLAFGAVAYGWAQLHHLTDNLTTIDVIGQQGKSVPPTGEQNILLVGLDTRTDAQGKPLPRELLDQLHAGGTDSGGDTTDTMILIHVPAGGGQAVAISIPRDSYVNVADGYGKHKINSGYTYGKNASAKQLRAKGENGPQLEVDSSAAGARTAIQTVEQFTGLSINHYAAVNLAGFYSLSNAIGGVPVCLAAPVRDTYSGANFPAGKQTVQGAQALQFVRQRHGLLNGDLDRIRRQQAFMASMSKAILSSGTLLNPSKLSNLIDALTGAITLDKGWDVMQFAQQLSGLSAGAIRFVTIPIVSITLHTPEDGDAVEVNPSQVQGFVKTTIQSGGDQQAGSSSSSPPADSGHSAVTVDVYNGTKTSGLARTVLDQIVAKGYTRGQPLTTTAKAHSSLRYAPGDEANAQALAAALGSGLTTTSDKAVPAGHLALYIGADYTAIAGQPGNSGTHQNATPANNQQPSSSSEPPAITADGIPCVN